MDIWLDIKDIAIAKITYLTRVINFFDNDNF